MGLGMTIRITCAILALAGCWRMLEDGMKPPYCAKILGYSVHTFLTTYACFIDADADAEQAAIWANIK
jgi:hypothetical protein